MKKFLLTAVALGICLVTWSQTLEPYDEASSVTFWIRNFGVKVSGSFKGLHGIIVFNTQDLSKAHFDVSVNPSSIDTGVGLRDKHLRKEEYFDVDHFNFIRFVSTKVEATTMKEFVITGNLTIKGKVKEIKFPFSVQRTGGVHVFTGTFLINRRDFDIGGSSISLADELNVQLAVRATVAKT